MEKVNNRFLIVLLCLSFFLFTNGCGSNEAVLYVESTMESGLDFESGENEITEPDLAEVETYVEQNATVQETIFVHVCGAVENPGVYELSLGARVTDAIEAAGGMTQDADSEYVNLAAVLRDEDRVRIPTVPEVESAMATVEQTEVFGGILSKEAVVFSKEDTNKININTASEEELCTLPGIGKTRAASILDYRQVYGRFSKIEDIMQVSGIKENSFEKIKDMITVN